MYSYTTERNPRKESHGIQETEIPIPMRGAGNSQDTDECEFQNVQRVVGPGGLDTHRAGEKRATGDDGTHISDTVIRVSVLQCKKTLRMNLGSIFQVCNFVVLGAGERKVELKCYFPLL